MKIKLIKIKPEYSNWDENHQHDYRWIKDKKTRLTWIKEHWICEVFEDE